MSILESLLILLWLQVFLTSIVSKLCIPTWIWVYVFHYVLSLLFVFYLHAIIHLLFVMWNFGNFPFSPFQLFVPKIDEWTFAELVNWHVSYPLPVLGISNSAIIIEIILWFLKDHFLYQYLEIFRTLKLRLTLHISARIDNHFPFFYYMNSIYLIYLILCYSLTFLLNCIFSVVRGWSVFGLFLLDSILFLLRSVFLGKRPDHPVVNYEGEVEFGMQEGHSKCDMEDHQKCIPEN